ncbi:hypothetical protein DER46DRAFT_622310 [Fusarium sp. MPI-SDFR-AT-0072]|nr:hypothetical protein DER46DRAFT_622310 [Fusarium sp. MPI-SDFR-AT-0072]
MGETIRSELKSFISTTGSHISLNPPNGQPTGLGESLQQSPPSWLRRVGLTQNPTFTEIPAAYYLGNNRSKIHEYYRTGADVFQGVSGAQSLISDMRTVLSASFSTQDVRVSHANTITSRKGRRDLWGNVRIPFLELLPGYNGDDPNAWISVPEDEIALWYHNTSSSIPLSQQFKDEVAIHPGYANMGYPNIWFDFPNSSTLTEHFTASPETEPQSKLQLVMGGRCSNFANQHTQMLRLCDISTSYIDMDVGCSRATIDADLVCHAKRARHTPSHPVKGNLTALSSFRLSVGVLPELPFTGASQHVSEPSILELYLRDPWGIFQGNGGAYMDDPYSSTKLGCFTSVPPEIIEQRLATALNTINMSGYEVNVLTGSKGAPSTYTFYAPVLWQNTTATWTEFDKDTYELDKLCTSRWKWKEWLRSL